MQGGPEEYLLYNGLSVDSDNVLGDYYAMVWFGRAATVTKWILTVRVGGEVALVEEGTFAGSSFTANQDVSYDSSGHVNDVSNSEPSTLATP